MFPLLLAVACDPSITVASGSALQVSFDTTVYTNLPALLVVTVDDGADANAAAVRALLTREGIVASFDMLFQRYVAWPQARTPPPTP